MARKAQTQETEEAVLDADREVEMSREEEERSLNEEFENEFEVSKGVRPDGLGTSEEIAAARPSLRGAPIGIPRTMGEHGRASRPPRSVGPPCRFAGGRAPTLRGHGTEPRHSLVCDRVHP
jgi:hypothetical protein